MPKLVVVRHAQYDPVSRRVTEAGRIQHSRLRGLAKHFPLGESVRILTSPLDSAFKTAYYLKIQLALNRPEIVKAKALEEGSPPSLAEPTVAREWLRAREKSYHLVVVTHFDQISCLILWAAGQATVTQVGYGYALLLDPEKKQASLIIPS